MRFKAKLATEQVQMLYSIVLPVSRLCGGGSGGNTSSSSSDALGRNPLQRATGKAHQHHLSLDVGAGNGSIVHIDPKQIRVSTKGRTVDTDGISCHIELECSVIFLDCRIESASDNAILFEIDLVHLRTALQSVISSLVKGKQLLRQPSLAQQQQQQYDDGDENGGIGAAAAMASSLVVIKLAKRNGLPCLCVDACGGYVEVHHALPIRVMRTAEMQYHLPPQTSAPTVQLELPSDRPLRTVMERLRTISPHVFVEGNMGGELTLRIDGDGASIRTFYSRLVPRFENCKKSSLLSSSQKKKKKIVQDSSDNDDGEDHSDADDDDDDPTEARCIVKVESKKLHTCLQWQATLRFVSSATLCMVENEVLVLHVVLNPRSLGFFTYYIPVHFLSVEMMMMD